VTTLEVIAGCAALLGVLGLCAFLGRRRLRDRDGPERTAARIAATVDASYRRGVLGAAEAGMLGAALRLVRGEARAAMVPSGSVVGVSAAATRDEVEAAWLRSGHTRLPVFDAGPDSIVGYVFAPEINRPDIIAWQGPIPRELMRPVLRVRRSRRLVDVLEDMRRSGTSFGVVTGAGGVALGILTLEDVLVQLLYGPLPLRA
jgi:CBS domain containing-hemolysin-like protein